jgi:hypothetical protein
VITGQLATLYVDLIARDKVAPALAEQQGRIKNLRDELAKVGTAGWDQQAKAYFNTQRQVADAQRQLARAFDVATLGAFAVNMRELVEKFGQLRQGIDYLGSGFPAVREQLVGFVAAASPDAFATFTVSLRYLSASIGQTLLPALVEVSALIQRGARWFQSLDEGTKKLISSTALWVLGLTGLFWALSRIVSVGASLLSFLNVLSRHPALMILAGLGMVLGGGAMEGMGIGGSGAGSLGHGVSMAGRAMTGGGFLAGAAYMGGAPLTATLAPLALAYAGSGRGGAFERLSASTSGVTPGGVTPAATTGYVREMRTEYTSILGMEFASAFRAELRRATPAEMRSMFPGVDPALVGPVGAEDRGIESTRADFWRRVDGIREGSALDLGMRSGLERGLGASAAGPGAAAGGAARDMLHATNFQSQFVGIEAEWKRIQQAGASNSPLEEEMRRIAMESREYLFSIAGSTATTASRPLPPPPTT